MSEVIKTTCPYCGVGCGVLAQVEAGGHVTVQGDPEHPANFGRLCSKGAALADTLSMDDRLLSPEVNGEVTTWDSALETVASHFQNIIEKYGANSVAFYVSGQLLTEDYYIANKLMKGFIGSANIDTNSRLCMSSAVAGQKRAFGSDTVPCSYEDLERAKLIVLTGSNTAWCHPVLFQRIKKAKQDNPDMMIVVIDPRKTATCDIADLHLAIKPGSDHILFNGLLVYLNSAKEKNELFVNNFTEGLDDAMVMAESYAATVEQVSEHCNLPAGDVEKFYRLFSRTERVVTLYSQGINQWSYGTDRVNSIINCHLFTGRIGRQGMGPFSLTGQPNAMGGREVGGLSNQLVAHMAIENEYHRELVKTFWQSPTIASKEGLKAVELFDAIDSGEIKAVWVMATNPAVSLPENKKVKQALKKCEFVVVSDCVKNTDTTRYADVLLPAQTWGERNGTVTNSERRISRQRPFLTSPGEARPDWWIISEVAKRLGFSNRFSYHDSAEIFLEYSRLSGYENDGERDFNISGLQNLTKDQYNDLNPIQWPVTNDVPSGTERLFSDGKFFTSTQRAQFIAVKNSTPSVSVTDEYPLLLNTGRVRDHWHTMTRTGKSAKLSGHKSEAFVEVHPLDAEKYILQNGGLAEVNSSNGKVICRVNILKDQLPGSIFIPIHWNDQYSGRAVVNELISSSVDPYSGQPEYKATPVSIKPFTNQWYGFVLSRRKLNISDTSYWSCSRGQGLWRYELAGTQNPDSWANHARDLLCQHAEQVEWTEYHDAAKNRYRAARIENGRLESCIFIGPDIFLPERDWLSNLFKDEILQDNDRVSVLSGKSAGDVKDSGRTICACYSVGLNTIVDAVKTQELITAEQVGDALRAGTNCGSCVSEIKEIIKLNVS